MKEEDTKREWKIVFIGKYKDMPIIFPKIIYKGNYDDRSKSGELI